MLRRLVATWGNSDFGRLGHVSLNQGGVDTPRLVGGLLNVNATQVATGGAHTAVVAGDGSLYTFGLNDHGQLGHSSDEGAFCEEPREVLIPEAVVAVTCGHYHTLALAESGTIWAFGKNSDGQLGLGKKGASAVVHPAPVRALQGAPIVEVCAGAEHSLARTAEGELFSWGASANGRLGHGTESLFLSWHQSNKTPRLVRALRGTKLTSLAAGHTCSGVVDDAGCAYTMGYGRFWQLGFGHDRDQPTPEQVPNLSGVAQLAMGGLQSIAVKRGGPVMVWGGNEHGCLGHGQPGRAERAPVMLPKLTVASASAGWQHSAAVGGNGELLTWGWGGSAGDQSAYDGRGACGGQLGLGNDFDYWTPTAVSELHIRGRALQQFVEGYDARFMFASVACGFNHTAAVVEVAAAEVEASAD